jgi:6-phosphogluconolactonase (cycloisomerase 2 family)
MAIRTRLSNTGTLNLSDIGAIYFENDGDSITLPSSSQFVITANQNFTLECWAYLRSSRTNTSYMIDFSDAVKKPLQIRIGDSTDNYRVQGVFGTTGTGALTQITTPIAAGTTPNAIATDPTGRFVYVTNNGANSVSQYSINSSTGALTQITTAIASGTGPYGIATDSTGRFVYVTNQDSNSVSQYSINSSTGVLTQITTAIASGNSPRGIATDSTGRFVYVANNNGNSVSQYLINQTTGALTQITTAIASGTNPNGIATDPTGRFVYVANQGANSVSQYSINSSTGALTQITTPIAAGAGSESIATDPTGRFVYVTNFNGSTVSQYSINQTTGALTQITTAIASGTGPWGIATDPTGRFVYVTNSLGSTVGQYSINTNLAKYENASYTQANLLNTWVHLALSRVGTDTRFFFNGINIASQSATGDVTLGTPTIARLGRPTPEQFNGYLSNVRYVVGTGLYSSNFTPSTIPLPAVTNTVLLTGQSPAIQDNSLNQFPLTLNGNPAPTDFSPFVPELIENVSQLSYKLDYPGISLKEIDEATLTSGSVYFDGNGDFLSIPSNTAFAFGTGDFTVEAWIMRTGGSGFQPICQSDAVGTSTNDKWWFGLTSTGLFFLN